MIARIFFFVAMLCAATSSALAAELRGTVTDSSGRPLAGAAVLVLTPQRGVVVTVETGLDGAFSVPDLPPGSYLVIARATGLDERQSAVDVRAETPSRVELVLSVAGLRETVSVTASPGAVLETNATAQAVNVIARSDIEQRAAAVTAQAFTEETGVALQRTSPTMAGVFVRGLTGNKVNVFVDGVRYSNCAQRGGVNTFLDLIDQSYLEGIEVLRGPNSAEYGSDALGGSVQFLSQVPALATGGNMRLGGLVDVRGCHGAPGWGRHRVGLARPLERSGSSAPSVPQSIGDVRPGDALDSHAAVTRFLGVSSDQLYADRLTGYRIRPVRRHARVELDAQRPTTRSCPLHGHAAGRRPALRPAARRRRQPDRGAERSDARSVLRARGTPARSAGSITRGRPIRSTASERSASTRAAMVIRPRPSATSPSARPCNGVQAKRRSQLSPRQTFRSAATSTSRG